MDFKTLIQIAGAVILILLGIVIYINLTIENVYYFNITLFTVTTVLVMWLLLTLYKKVSKLKELINASDLLSKGNFNVDIVYNVHKKDAVNELAINLTILRDTLKRIFKEIDNLGILHDRGEIDRIVESDNYRGLYREAVVSISKMAGTYKQMTEDVVTNLTNMANGNFTIALKQYEGKKKELNTSMELLSSNLKQIGSEITTLIQNVDIGNLDYKADSNNFSGNWKEILEGLNNILISFTKPIQQMKETLGYIASGNLTTQMQGQYDGEFKNLQQSINQTANTLHKYIRDINIALTEVASNNLNIKIDNWEQQTTKGGNNDIGEIKDALNNIIEKFAKVLKSIKESAIQIDDGTKVLTENAGELASAASQSEETIMELNTVITSVSSVADNNSKKAESASKISKLLEEASHQNLSQMGEMIVSMKEIEKSSQNIVSIIKSIEDISFQTNLLALNASVEAARAGEHGRGFAVVAEEVRSLSQRTTSLTKDISEVIQISSGKIKEGTQTVQLADTSLKDMVEKINDVSNNINEISAASIEQARDIESIKQSFNELTETQKLAQNSAVINETSSNLDDLSDNLKDMVSSFVLE
ncbi:MAG: methyl-accepting chemotaxis protein [Defluviitaleaceae bacterium]|nr:methyl-accepting chemotaxis protein [Defluviitaleaceae bacterium]